MQRYRDKRVQIEAVGEWKFDDKEFDEAIEIVQSAKAKLLGIPKHDSIRAGKRYSRDYAPVRVSITAA
jgi:hypothetical protein